MGYRQSSKALQMEAKLQEAIQAYKKGQFPSVRSAANHFEVSPNTLARRISGGLSHREAMQIRQILSDAEEKTLIRWITRYTIAGSPISPALLIEMAQLIRVRRMRRVKGNEVLEKTMDHIGHEWLYRFLNRHEKLKGIYARQMENLRYDGASFEVVKSWFDAVAQLVQEHSYEYHNIWNMDESGFGVGESQSTRVLVPIDLKTKHKKVAGKQEWVTVFECINAAGEAIAPLVIFKAKYLNSGWIPAQTHKDWHFGTSENGWTSNAIGLRWLVKVFEPQTRAKAAGKRRLLIADGHGSHIRADFVAYCMEHEIDLLILPPHCSHILQPLDVGVFSAFKRAHTNETDTLSRLSTQRISRCEWLELFTRAREKAVTFQNIRSGWRGAGLVPSDPQKILDRLPSQAMMRPSKPRTPPDHLNLDFSLLASSPPDGTELRKSNVLLNEVLADVPNVPTPVKRYVDRVTRMAETQNTELTIKDKIIADQRELLHTRKKRKRGKRVQMEGEFIYSTPEALEVVRAAEATPIAKKPKRRPRKRTTREISSEEEAEELEGSSSESEVELIENVVREKRWKLEILL